jgi:acetolactate synthase-1/2/3 large subunit
MNGAQALIRTLVDAGVDVCFMNPGTSEMHFVAALDAVPEMRGVLALFEGVATGAADGYARMTGRPAATLLHLGPGLGNGLANLHNARRAGVPMVNIVGDHATFHQRYDPPLQSDIETVARNVSSWIRSSASPADVGADAAAAVTAALGPPGSIATLVLPADTSWSEGAQPAAALPVSGRSPVDGAVVDKVRAALTSGEPAALMLGGAACRGGALAAARRVADGTGAKLLAETFPARLERGAGRPVVDRLAYLAELAALQLDGLRHLVLVDCPSPVSFFAYPDRPSDLVPEGCAVHVLAGGADDIDSALAALATAVDAPVDPAVAPAARPDLPVGPLDSVTAAAVIGALLPEGAVVVDEAATSGLSIPGATAGAPPHDYLCLTGGAIGQGLPTAVGAAVACPDRPVLALEADGSALYTIQALWTMAREHLDVTVIVFDNRAYAVLRMELDRVGAEASGDRARSMLSLDDPALDFVALAQGFGVPATRATTVDELADQLAAALGAPGPHLIDAVVPPIF